ncbi:MAG: hypothetical protein IIC92_04145, partial [Chloroflexi bacterium]|nr:hypothetical protein [Chloroflexota bacterium]
MQELGSDPSLGGLRDPLNFWDFTDMYTGDPPVRDRAVTVGDIGAVVDRFGTSRESPPTTEEAFAEALTPPTETTGYHASLDRGGS